MRVANILVEAGQSDVAMSREMRPLEAEKVRNGLFPRASRRNVAFDFSLVSSNLDS